jgi:GxxExxY protein
MSIGKFNDSALTGKIIGCAMEVHNSIGNGFQEVIYQRCLSIEFDKSLIAHKREYNLDIYYKDQLVGVRRADFLVEDCIIVEIKAVKELEDMHLAQAINYLEVTGYKTGLLINFGNRKLQFKRVMQPYQRQS